MKTLNVKNNDIEFTLAEGKEEIMRCLELDLGSALNEFLLDEEIGVDKEVTQNKPSAEDILLEVQRIINNEPRVRLVSDMTYRVDKTTREMFVELQLEEVETGEIWSQEVSLGGANE